MNLRKEYKEPVFSTYDKVKYVPYNADNDTTHSDCEVGFVSTINDRYVFVKFVKQLAKFGWSGTTSQACTPDTLRKMQGTWQTDTF